MLVYLMHLICCLDLVATDVTVLAVLAVLKRLMHSSTNSAEATSANMYQRDNMQSLMPVNPFEPLRLRLDCMVAMRESLLPAHNL